MLLDHGPHCLSIIWCYLLTVPCFYLNTQTLVGLAYAYIGSAKVELPPQNTWWKNISQYKKQCKYDTICN